MTWDVFGTRGPSSHKQIIGSFSVWSFAHVLDDTMRAHSEAALFLWGCRCRAQRVPRVLPQ